MGGWSDEEYTSLKKCLLNRELKERCGTERLVAGRGENVQGKLKMFGSESEGELGD